MSIGVERFLAICTPMRMQRFSARTTVRKFHIFDLKYPISDDSFGVWLADSDRFWSSLFHLYGIALP